MWNLENFLVEREKHETPRGKHETLKYEYAKMAKGLAIQSWYAKMAEDLATVTENYDLPSFWCLRLTPVGIVLTMAHRLGEGRNTVDNHQNCQPQRDDQPRVP